MASSIRGSGRSRSFEVDVDFHTHISFVDSSKLFKTNAFI